MDNYQENNQEEYTELQENVGEIDPNVLRTPAKEPERLDQKIPQGEPDTFFHFNNPREMKPGSDVILDLGGEKSQLDTKANELKTETKFLHGVFGSDMDDMKEISSGTLLLAFFIFVGLFFFILFNVKKSEQIMRLEKELDNIKKGGRV